MGHVHIRLDLSYCKRQSFSSDWLILDKCGIFSLTTSLKGQLLGGGRELVAEGSPQTDVRPGSASAPAHLLASLSFSKRAFSLCQHKATSMEA